MGRSALVLSPEYPYPVQGGGALRTASLIEYLARSGPVDLVTFAEQQPPAVPPPVIRNQLVIPLRRHARHWTARLIRNGWRAIRQVPPLVDRFAGYQTVLTPWLAGRTYDVAVVEHLWAAPYAAWLRPHAGRLVLDLHNIESVLQRRLRLPFAAASARIERKWVPRFDLTLVTSAADASHLGQPARVYPNGIPPRPAIERKERDRIVMSGNFEFPPNRRGLQWLLAKVWPELRRKLGCELHLVGRHSEQFAGQAGISFTGPVDDAIAEIATARVALVPLQAGSGTRLKILEAWQARTPVVSTTLGAEGLAAQAGRELLLADTPEAFAQAVLALWEDEPKRRQISEWAGIRLQQNYLWPAVWAQFDEAGALY